MGDLQDHYRSLGGVWPHIYIFFFLKEKASIFQLDDDTDKLRQMSDIKDGIHANYEVTKKQSTACRSHEYMYGHF